MRNVIFVLAMLASGGAYAELPVSLSPAQFDSALQLKGDPERGKAVFAECAGCHRKDAAGRSSGSIPRLAGQHAAVIRKQLLDIRSGKRNNPLMAPLLDDPELTLEAIADVASYLASLPVAGPTGKGPGTQIERGRSLYLQDCVRCHGANGEGLAAHYIPRVTDQHYGYLLRELQLIRTSERGNSDPDMIRVLKPYPDTDLEALADYLSQLPPP
ncbi:cytochrome c [Niveibacterium sp.]|uniref:c-type cytochrome n=1 Tax=Niveibacterium sp. TaxID=2017444 RepID=UPI0035B2A848